MALSLAAGLGIALAVAGAALAGVTSAYLGERDKVAKMEEAAKHTADAVKACQGGVDAVKAAASGVQAAVTAALAEQGGKITDLQQRANRALAAKPANPADLCGSARLYIRDQIRAERAASAP